LLVFAYSAGVNTLGAITSSASPPQGEAAALEKISGLKQDYTYLREWKLIENGNSKSFVFQVWAKNFLTAQEYFWLIVRLIVGGALTVGILPYIFNKGERYA